MPKVSVILPNFNHVEYLKQRIDTILNQTFQDFEVIMLDDCSTDNSRQIIELYRNHPKVSQIVYNEVNGGTSYKQWYKGIQYAKGDLIWIAESDDWCELNFLEYLVPHFDDKEVSLAFCKSVDVKNNDVATQCLTLTGEFSQLNGNQFIGSCMITGNGIRNGSMVVFRKGKYLLLQSSRWKDLLFAGDWLLWVELANQSKVVEVQDTLNYFRIHSGSASPSFYRLGLFFIEGLEVLKRVRFLTNTKNTKLAIYKIWTNLFFINKHHFGKGVTLRVLCEFVKFDFIFIFFFTYKYLRNSIKKIYYFIFNYNK